MHKTANALNKLPKSVQPRAKRHLQDIWMAETKQDANKDFDFFLKAYGAKYDKASSLPSQKSGRVVNLLRSSGRALETHQNDQPHREHLRNGASADDQNQRLPQPHDGAYNGLQSCVSRPAKNGAAWMDLTRSPPSCKGTNSRTEK